MIQYQLFWRGKESEADSARGIMAWVFCSYSILLLGTK